MCRRGSGCPRATTALAGRGPVSHPHPPNGIWSTRCYSPKYQPPHFDELYWATHCHAGAETDMPRKQQKGAENDGAKRAFQVPVSLGRSIMLLHNRSKPKHTTTLTSGTLRHRNRPHPAACGKRLPSHPAIVSMPETRTKYGPVGPSVDRPSSEGMVVGGKGGLCCASLVEC